MKVDKATFSDVVFYVVQNKLENKQFIFVERVQMHQLYVIQNVSMYIIATYKLFVTSKKIIRSNKYLN